MTTYADESKLAAKHGLAPIVDTGWQAKSDAGTWSPAEDCDGSQPPAGADLVNHPPHYGSHPSGVECITVTEHMSFNLGNAVKYIWRAGLKSDDAKTDLEKARWYVEREIGRVSNAARDPK